MTSIVTDYEQAFVRRAHQLLSWGYAKARCQFDHDTEEEVISQYISEQILAIIQYDLQLPDEYLHFEVDNERPVSDAGRTGRRRKEMDLVIKTTDLRIRPRLVLEAKRLKTGAFYVRDYVGADGMLCFVNEEYAAQCSYAAMVAYMQSDNADHWYDQLTRQFDNPKNTDLRVTRPLAPCQVVSDLPNEWTSEHNRVTRSAILVYHIFLDCQ